MAITMVERPASQESKSFRIGKYTVTQVQYQAVMGVNPSYFQGNPQNTLENFSYDDAETFCQKLSKATGKQYRLPTNSEWEYACRAGTTTRFYFGDDANQLGNYAWYWENSQKTTHPVGQKKPNAWGLYDMHGNAWEMTEEEIKLRGGSWYSDPDYCYSAYYIVLARLAESIGFRVVCDK